ncbi:hypothetical protein BDZ89DRAFT_1107695 [Hymenopellis radicata]|nr:hypothetical protein BDZ89DRAFT_1107695 [Hymenopellis radicata]
MSTDVTPASEKGLPYFDAPVAHFHTMSTPTQDLDHPIAKPDDSEAVAELARDPTIVATGVSEQPPAAVEDRMVNGIEVEADETVGDVDNVHLHPNGSEGWLPAEDHDVLLPSLRSGSILRKTHHKAASVHARAASLRRGGSLSQASVTRAASVGGQSTRGIFTKADGQPVAGSTFIHGAGTTGPNVSVEADESLHARAASANNALSSKQKTKVQKAEAKEGKHFSKIIKTEGKVERQALSVALKQLSELQTIQKEAVKRESKAYTVHTKSFTSLQKYEAALLAARRKYETMQAQFNADAEALEVARNNAREVTESMQEKSQEVDGLRTMFSVDEREREVKLVELSGKNAKSKIGWRG